MPTELINVWTPDGTWVGSFITENYARDWVTNNGFKIEDCEISTRRYVREDSRLEQKEETA